MPKLHIIIGDANTRKSSALRCLVGNAHYGDYDIALVTGPSIVSYCQLLALQEEGYNPTQFIGWIKKHYTPPPSDSTISLRVNPVGPYPAFDAYLNQFSHVGWILKDVALLGPTACSQQHRIHARNLCLIPAAPAQPTNQTANHVRKAWGWQ